MFFSFFFVVYVCFRFSSMYLSISLLAKVGGLVGKVLMQALSIYIIPFRCFACASEKFISRRLDSLRPKVTMTICHRKCGFPNLASAMSV